MQRHKISVVASCVFVCCLIFMVSAHAQTVAFVNVNVIPMDSDMVLGNHTVIVQDGFISEMGASDQVTIPDGAQIVDGGGGYLMPGLADMHTHLGQFDTDPRHLLLYLAEGTTTVRTLSGSKLELGWRDRVAQGELVGPSILVGRVMYGKYRDSVGVNGLISMFRLGVVAIPLVVAGMGMLFGLLPKELYVGLGALAASALSWVIPYPDASPTLAAMLGREGAYIAESSAQAVQEVARMHKLGFDFFKPYDGLTLADFEASVGKARELDLYTLGHLPNQIPLETAFSAGLQEIAHMDELLSYHWRDYDPTAENDPEKMRLGFSVSDDKMAETVATVQGYDIPVVANLSTDELIQRLIFDTEGVLAGAEYDVIRPEWIESWRNEGRNVTAFAEQGPNRRDETQPFLEALTLALHQAGVLITIGTDTSVEGCIPSNIHLELELLVRAGFSPYEALAAGTQTASMVVDRMGKGNEFGTVEVGKRADLILLNNNPLENVSHTRDRQGVMAQGVWYSQDELDAMVQAFVATY